MIYCLLLSIALCVAYGQHVEQYCDTFEMEHKIVDIKSSVRQGATLLDGTYKETLSGCVMACCDMEECDLAVYRIKGTSSSNRNCYLVHCGVSDNCILVSHVNFTAISLSNGNTEEVTTSTSPTPTVVVNPTIITSSDEDDITESTSIASTTSVTIPITLVPVESTTSTYRSPSPTPISSTYTPSSHVSSSSSSSTSSSTATSSLTTTSSVTTTIAMLSSSTVMPAPTLAVNPKVPKPALGEPGDSSKKPADDDHHLCGNANCSKSKIAGLVVACILVAVLLAIVIGVVVKKSWDRHRHTKYKKIDYLIDGMYS